LSGEVGCESAADEAVLPRRICPGDGGAGSTDEKSHGQTGHCSTVSLARGCVFPGLTTGAFLGEAPSGLDMVALRAADAFWLGRGGPGAHASGTDCRDACGRGRADRRRGPECGFWLIVAAGKVETDSGLRVLGSGWAGSGCGDWVCGDFRKSADSGDGAGWLGGLRSEKLENYRPVPRFCVSGVSGVSGVLGDR
jgi:hypothetical protein